MNNKHDFDAPVRKSSDMVAVNPERVITLLQLVMEHYQGRCLMCQRRIGRQLRGTAHHRHYRTVGYEQPVEDVVLLCWPCHNDLHQRSQSGGLTHRDIPFVDPQWAGRLEHVKTVEEIGLERAAAGIYYPANYDASEFRRYRIVIRKQSGDLKTVVEQYPSLEVARSNAESQRAYFDDLSVESVEEIW